MDTELIKMCDTPEIQDRWEPKDADRFYNTHFKGHYILPDREACEGGPDCECCNWETIEVKESEYIIYIPRIEDVLEWETVGGLRTKARAMEAIIEYTEKHQLWDYPLLQTALVYHMERKHGKNWHAPGEAWD